MRQTERASIIFQLDVERTVWLETMAVHNRESVAEVVERLVHNATLDWQRDHYPESEPDDSLQDARIVGFEKRAI